MKDERFFNRLRSKLLKETDKRRYFDLMAEGINSYIANPPMSIPELSRKYGISVPTLRRRSVQLGIGYLSGGMHFIDFDQVHLITYDTKITGRPKKESK